MPANRNHPNRVNNQIDYVKTEHMSSEELLLRGVPQQTVCQ